MTTENNGPTKSKPGRRPGGALRYPAYDLDASVEVAQRLHERAGGVANLKTLAVYLGYSGTHNGSFINRMAAARLFGLVDGPPTDVALTERARAILMPEYDDSETQARVEAFEQVPLYRAVLDAFEGKQLPAQEGLVNALQNRYDVPAGKARGVLDRLIKSADQAGLFKISGDRSRMIRPRLDDVSRRLRASDGELSAPSAGELGARAEVVTPRAASRHKLIDGALDELPAIGVAWTEEGLQQWLDLIEHSVRVIWKLPARQARAAPPDDSEP
jgi:hypothetical protein